MSEITIIQAINMALRRALEDDPAVVVLGQDVGRHGGVFRRVKARGQAVGWRECGLVIR